MYAKAKFDSLPLKQRHKKAAELLRVYYTSGDHAHLEHYLTLASYLEVPPVSENAQAIADRYHLHLNLAGRSLAEHNLLPTKTADKLTGAPFGTHTTYLDNLRSAFNVGAILRTVEAFRLGPVIFGGSTPTFDHPKVQKTAMGCADLIPTTTELSGPVIALETAPNAIPIHKFKWPSSCTLIVGNEEYGISHNLLEKADHTVSIPLCGGKASLNVATAFGIAAHAISTSCL